MKLDSLGNLISASNFIKSEQKLYRDRQQLVNEFNSLDLYERMRLYRKYKRNKFAYLGSATEWDKINIMKNYDNNRE